CDCATRTRASRVAARGDSNDAGRVRGEEAHGCGVSRGASSSLFLLPSERPFRLWECDKRIGDSMHPSLRTPLCDLLGIRYPIVQAGMGYVARADLCAAVSAAGGLGMIGAASLTAPELRDEIRKVRGLTDRPFGVDVLFATIGRPAEDDRTVRFTRDVEAQIEVVFEEKVPILASGLGNPGPV